jgi:NAD(P) transhydrogenase subunit alpha
MSILRNFGYNLVSICQKEEKMSVTVVFPKERTLGEGRIAIVPQVAEKLIKLGVEVKIQQGLGKSINIEDAAFKNVKIVKTAKELYAAGDMVLKINPPSDQEIAAMKKDSILVSLLYPHTRPGILKKLCSKKITSFALEMIPRTISKAQSMDVLSSQATVMGYAAVLIAANQANFFFPMLSTAAGTIRSAKVLIIGAGVAGLQAIATARRLGARVEAYDVRPETKLQVASLGAMFVDTGVEAVGAGGYARELTATEKKQQQQVLEKHIAESDVVITTAGVPGKPAPKIISKAVVGKMKPGAIIVDIMAEMGGNCELAKPGKNVTYKGVIIVGTKNITSELAVNASEMFARNILNFITPMFKEGKIDIDWDDEVIARTLVTRDGKIFEEK